MFKDAIKQLIHSHKAIMKLIPVLLVILSTSTLGWTQSINTENLSRLVEYCNTSKADEILIRHQDKILVHWKRTDMTGLQIDSHATPCLTPYMGTASMVKSWTGLLIGILVDKGYIQDINDAVCTYMPEWKIGCQQNITIRHLLTMTGGYNRLGPRGVLSQKDMNQFVLNLEPDTLPGIRFSYSNESVQLLGIIAERVTGLRGDELFTTYLLQPLGMDSTSFSKDESGNIIFYGGCTTTVEDASRIGQLMLNQGQWKGNQMISSDWVTASTTPGPLAPYYGYLWWLDKNAPHWNFAATGDLGQMTIVFPDLHLVFIRKQACDLSPSSLSMSWMGPTFLEHICSIIEP